MRAIGTLFYSLLSAVLAAIAIQYFVGGWNEEYLSFSLAEPVQVSKGIWRRNIELRNSGVDPAINVRVYVTSVSKGEFPNVKAEFDSPGDGTKFLGGFERIRRKENVLLSATTKETPLTEFQIQIKSDRSVAEFRESAPWAFWPWSWWPGVGTFFFVYIFLAIALPARKDYLEAARRAREMAERRGRQGSGK